MCPQKERKLDASRDQLAEVNAEISHNCDKMEVRRPTLVLREFRAVREGCWRLAAIVVLCVVRALCSCVVCALCVLVCVCVCVFVCLCVRFVRVCEQFLSLVCCAMYLMPHAFASPCFGLCVLLVRVACVACACCLVLFRFSKRASRSAIAGLS